MWFLSSSVFMTTAKHLHTLSILLFLSVLLSFSPLYSLLPSLLPSPPFPSLSHGLEVWLYLWAPSLTSHASICLFSDLHVPSPPLSTPLHAFSLCFSSLCFRLVLPLSVFSLCVSLALPSRLVLLPKGRWLTSSNLKCKVWCHRLCPRDLCTIQTHC